MNSKLFSENSRDKDIQTSYSKKFPFGLPFEDEFYYKRHERSISVKSMPSDYGSIDIDNHSIHSQSLLSIEEEYACQRPTSEAIYVDFSKLIYESKSAYLRSIRNSYRSSFESPVPNIAFLINNNTLHSGGVTNDQRVLYVDIKWCSKHMKSHNDYISYRLDTV